MLEFFTKLFTPVFITLGLVNPAPVIPEQPQPVVQREIIREETLDIETTEDQEVSEEATEEIIVEIKPEPIIEKPVVTPKPIYIPPVVTPKPIYIPPVVAQEVEEIIPIKVPEVIIQQEEIIVEPIEVISDVVTNSEPDAPTGEAKCGNAENETYELNIPTENLCSNGTPTKVTQYKLDSYRWSCETEDDKDRCKAVRAVDGVCGDIPNNAVLPEKYDEEILCKEGILEINSINKGVLNYFCNATDKNSFNVSCSAQVELRGKCGSINNQKISGISAEEACSAGNYNLISSDNGEFIWECSGSNGGRKSNCSAERITPNYDGCIGGGRFGACA